MKRTCYLTFCVYLKYISESSLIHLSCVLYDVKTPNISNSCGIKSFVCQTRG